MLLILAGQLIADSPEPIDRVHFLDTVHGQELRLCYAEPEDRYYLYLPSYAEPENIRAECEPGTRIFLPDGSPVVSLDDLHSSGDAVIQVARSGSVRSYTVRIMRCQNLPALFVDMPPDGLDWLNTEKERKQPVYLRFVDAQGAIMHQNYANISGRGNGSWRDGEKKPYNLSFSAPVTLGPFENVTALNMIADYSDESRMRNALANYCGHQMEIPYSTPYMQTDIYVNGEYLGLYGICTKQEYEKHIDQDQIQAVFEIAGNKSGPHFITEESQHIVKVMYGSLDLVEEQVNRLECALAQQDWNTSEQLLDIKSFARKYALDEFMGNVDMPNASQYFFIDAQGKIQSMLPWDYDWSIGSAINFFNIEHGYGLMTPRSPSYWASRLLDYDGFCQEVKRVLEEEYDDDFLLQLRNQTLTLEDTIAASRACDAQYWRYSEPYCRGASHFENLSELRDFFLSYFTQRRDHLIRYFSAPEEFCLVEFEYEMTGYYFNYLIPKGSRLSDYQKDKKILSAVADGYQVLGWYTHDGLPLDQLDVITQDVKLYPALTALEGYEGIEDAADESLMDKLLKRKGEVLILTLFGLSALILLGVQLRHSVKKERVNA